jgi:hypothetical protein
VGYDDAMRYRLRTLLIASIVGPPLLALLWFGAIWARYSLSPLLGNFLQSLLLPGIGAVLVLVVYSVAAPWPGRKPAVLLPAWQCLLLGVCQFLAEWQWLYVAIEIGGWGFIWGDNGPPVSSVLLAMIAAAVAVASTGATGFRVGRGLATAAYIRIVLGLVVPLLGVATLFWLTYLLR